MKDCSPELQTLLAGGGPFLMADCYTITLASGTVLRVTSADKPVAVSDVVFQAHQMLISGLQYTQSVGVDVDEQEITIAARDQDTVDGVPALVALANGAFDLAAITWERAFMADWGQPGQAAVAVGTLNLFHGRMSTVDEIGATSAQVKVKSDLVLLNVDFPVNSYQPSCLHVFGSPQCGVDLGAITVNGVATGGDYSTVMWEDGSIAGRYDQGTVLFTGGNNADISANIKQSTGLQLVLSYPLEQHVQAGDSFKACPGCPHTKEACDGFGGNFRGYPFVPPPVTAL